MPPKLGILAGGGELPRRLIEACRQHGRDVFLVAFEGQTDRETAAETDHVWLALGRVGEAVAALKDAGVEEIVMAGGMRRPSLKELRLDARHALLFAKLGLSKLGDDGLLRAIIDYLEGQGFRVVGVDDLLDSVLAEAGCYGALAPDDQANADIRRGIAVASALGGQDVGQAAVVQQGIVLGVEAAEGTDALLERCAGLARGGPGGVLVKIRKPGQERRADLPTIGTTTVEGALAAGLRGIAVEVGGALILDRRGVAEAADRAGIFVVGVTADF